MSATSTSRITVDIKAQLKTCVAQLDFATKVAYPGGYLHDNAAHAALNQVKATARILESIVNSITIEAAP